MRTVEEEHSRATAELQAWPRAPPARRPRSAPTHPAAAAADASAPAAAASAPVSSAGSAAPGPSVGVRLPVGGASTVPKGWAALVAKLPTAPEQRDARRKLFSSFDPNGNGHCSLAEVGRGIQQTLGADYDAALMRWSTPAVNRPFHSAQGAGGRASCRATGSNAVAPVLA